MTGSGAPRVHSVLEPAGCLVFPAYYDTLSAKLTKGRLRGSTAPNRKLRAKVRRRLCRNVERRRLHRKGPQPAKRRTGTASLLPLPSGRRRRQTQRRYACAGDATLSASTNSASLFGQLCDERLEPTSIPPDMGRPEVNTRGGKGSVFEGKRTASNGGRPRAGRVTRPAARRRHGRDWVRTVIDIKLSTSSG